MWLVTTCVKEGRVGIKIDMMKMKGTIMGAFS